MSKIIRIGVVTLYVFLICFNALLTLTICGIFISWWTLSIVMTAWALACWLSVYYLSPIHLFFHGRLRPPIMEEEARLQGCLMEVLRTADCHRKFNLCIVEEKQEMVLSIGHDTIAVSASLLKELTDDELKGIMAHELGHLISRDTMVSWAFAMADHIPKIMSRHKLLFPLLLIFPVVYFIVGFFSNTLIFPIGGVWIFMGSSVALSVLFRWLDRQLLRQREYRQDEYAHCLGYGRGLRDALVKLAQAGEQQVNAWLVLLYGRTPVIYHRIRRLEQLLAWRISGSSAGPQGQ